MAGEPFLCPASIVADAAMDGACSPQDWRRPLAPHRQRRRVADPARGATPSPWHLPVVRSGVAEGGMVSSVCRFRVTPCQHRRGPGMGMSLRGPRNDARNCRGNGECPSGEPSEKICRDVCRHARRMPVNAVNKGTTRQTRAGEWPTGPVPPGGGAPAPVRSGIRPIQIVPVLPQGTTKVAFTRLENRK